MSLCLYPSLLWTVISHQGAPSLPIPSSLRQFHSTPRLCHSISVHLAVSLHPQAPNHHYSFIASRVRSTVTVVPWRGFSYPLLSDLRRTFRLVTRVPVHRLSRQPPRMRTGTHICASRPSDVHRHALNWQSASCRGRRADVAPVSHVSPARN